MSTNDQTWLAGRELLLGEIGSRVAEIRNRSQVTTGRHGLCAGLVIYMERRLIRMRQALAALTELSYPASETGEQSLDRMVSSLVATLRHAEADLAAVVDRPRESIKRRAARSLGASCQA